jgi:hypothetical protein
MPYIGKNLVGILKDARASDIMTGDGSDTTLTLTDTPGSTNNVLVFLDGIRQTPVTDYTVMGRTLTFTTAPEAGVLVVALTGSASSIDPKMGSVTSSKIVDGMVGNAKIATMSASKLTGALPAISGANLTNIPTTGIDNVTSDPTISENPAGGVGTIQLNQNSGEMFVCTDATAGANVWINVGGGTGDVQPYSFGGTIKGFSMGAESGSSELNIIEHYSYSSDGDATDAADLTVGTEGGAGGKSETHGYYLGGKNSSNTPVNTIQKFAFASISNATNVATLKEVRKECAGVSSQTHIFVTGSTAAISGSASLADDIQKIATASDANGVRTGDLTNNHSQGTAHTSETHGYAVGGYTTASSGSTTNVIERYSLSSDENASDVGDMTMARRACNGMSSSTHGYTSAGHPTTNVIDKYQFSASANATDVGDLTVAQQSLGASSSTTHGYKADGGNSGSASNQIEKISFSTDGNASDIGNLTNSGGNRAGTQH